MKYIRRAGYLQGVLTGRDGVDERVLFGYSDNINKQWLSKYLIAHKINTAA